MKSQKQHQYRNTIQQYYYGCSTADFDLMMSTFDPDVVHYFVDHSAVRGAAALANYWVKVGPKTQASWTLDHILVQEPEAVIEWSMPWTPPQDQKRQMLRGTEWYLFKDDKIAEIRSYHNNYYLHDPKNRELWDFPYEERGYPRQILK
ncbi:nuclear transport factor 2 family protein [Sneathiella sp.]|uniref:nuclear transport factor 2 family protein n=1 Tax=Sneathiella sp. TaxID=1964365 RepID=UPI0025F93280|nr:nuclear transport factor 2 family protein [Sneathiella sp.]